MHITTFEQYRPLLFSIAYRMLGTVTEAEDMVQETYLRVQETPEETLERPQAYLTTVISRLCLNRLTAASRQRETYLGPWLPEPLLTDERTQIVNPLNRVTTYDSLSIAFLTLLESLSPAERAVFILHEVFDYKHAEIGQMLDKSTAACRQLFRRAKQHVVANRPRYETTPEEHERLLHSFIEVVEEGDLDSFLQMLAEDVVLVPDGGGERGAAIRILRGRDAVSKFIVGVRRVAPPNLHISVAEVNGQPAALLRTQEGQIFTVVAVSTGGGQIQTLHAISGRKLRVMQAGGGSRRNA